MTAAVSPSASCGGAFCGLLRSHLNGRKLISRVFFPQYQLDALPIINRFAYRMIPLESMNRVFTRTHAAVNGTTKEKIAICASPLFRRASEETEKC